MNTVIAYDTWVQIVQYTSIILALSVIGFQIQRMITEPKEHFVKGALVVIWMLHIIVYYIYVIAIHRHMILVPEADVFLTSWSASLRLHGLTTLLVNSVIHLTRAKLIGRAMRRIAYGSEPDSSCD